MNLIALPAFTDHRIRMLHDDHQTLVVDPGESAPVTGVPDSMRLVLAAILVTHHHGNRAPRTSVQRHRSPSRRGALVSPGGRALRGSPFGRRHRALVTRRAGAAGMRGAEPGAGLAVLRQWKSDLR